MSFLLALWIALAVYLPLFLMMIPLRILPFAIPFDQWARIPFFLVHTGLSFFTSFVWMVFYYCIQYLLFGDAVFEYIPILKVGLFMYIQGLIFYGVFTGVFYSVQFQAELREKAVKTAKLEALSRQAEIKALKSQVNPHFLFNTLNTIYALMDSNVSQAKKTVTELSDLLRYSMAGFYREYVPLKEELDMVKRYLDIEKSRFGERLTVQYQVENDTLNHPVPPMLLQPLVENAIKHGIGPLKEGGTVILSVQREDNTLHFIVEDTGRGDKAEENSVEKNGIGLQNLKQRLSHLYGDEYLFHAGSKEDGGFLVEVWLPVDDSV